MRVVSLFAPLACLLLIGTSPLSAAQQNPTFQGDPHKLEADVLADYNVARSQPNAYVETLMNYRGFFKANLVVIPGHNIDVETQEGTVPVDEAIDFLQTHEALKSLAPSEVLAKAAAMHVADQGKTGRTGHYGADGSGPAERVIKAGGGKNVAEVIAYGAIDAQDVIRQLIIDDGVADRGHRVVMFAEHLRYAGVACGPHPEFGTMCVIEMADTPDGSAGSASGPVRHVATAAMDNTQPTIRRR